MTDLLQAALAFPTVIFTVLLMIATLWWLLVIVGLFDIEIPGLDSFDGDLDADLGEGGWSSGVFAFLGLARVPFAVGTSLVVLFAWLFTLLGLRGLASLSPGLAASAVIASLVALAALLVGAVLAGQVARAIAPAFATVQATSHSELVGRTCRVTSPLADARGGRAELDDGGAGLILEIRRPSGAALRRGEEAVIYAHDPRLEVFLVAPLGSDEAPAPNPGETPR